MSYKKHNISLEPYREHRHPIKQGSHTIENISVYLCELMKLERFYRLLHHADTVIIEGKSFRMKGQLEPN